MTSTVIKGLLQLRGDNLTAIAQEIGESRTFLSDVINYNRDFNEPAVRRVALKFALRLGMKLEQVFDGVEPASKKEVQGALKSLKNLGLAVPV